MYLADVGRMRPRDLGGGRCSDDSLSLAAVLSTAFPRLPQVRWSSEPKTPGSSTSLAVPRTQHVLTWEITSGVDRRPPLQCVPSSTELAHELHGDLLVFRFGTQVCVQDRCFRETIDTICSEISIDFLFECPTGTGTEWRAKTKIAIRI